MVIRREGGSNFFATPYKNMNIFEQWAKGISKNVVYTALGATTAANAVNGTQMPRINDKTNENLGTEIVQPLDAATIQRNEEWAREDAIRKETQEREDNAIRRMTEDALKAGWSPAAIQGQSAAQSGGGITSQTKSKDYTMTEAEFNANLELLMQEIDQKFEADQNEKDRVKDLIKSLITGGAILGGAAMKAGK